MLKFKVSDEYLGIDPDTHRVMMEAHQRDAQAIAEYEDREIMRGLPPEPMYSYTAPPGSGPFPNKPVPILHARYCDCERCE